MAFHMLSSCEKNPSKTTQTLKLGYSFGSENSMYQTRSVASDIFDEFYAKLSTGELVADTYNLTFKEVESGAEYSFSGSWKGATVELQAATYKVTGKSTAVGENTQEKCSIFFDETITVTNQMTEIVLNAKYDCYLFVMTSEKLNKVDNCFFFNNKYWYAFVNGNFVNTLTGSHKDGSKFSVEMNDYRFDKGKYYVYYDVSINEYGVSFLIEKMENGLEEPEIPLNQIWYTTDNGEIFNPNSGCKFYNSAGNSLSFTQSWDGEKWIMNFSDNISYWTGDWFYVTSSSSRLVTFGAPSGLDPIKMDNAGHFYQKSFNGDYVSTIEKFFGQYAGIADNGHLFLKGENLKSVMGVATAYTGTITVPEGVKEIGMYSFCASKAKVIILPSTLETIWEYAFENCIELTDMYCYATTCPSLYKNNIWTYVSGTTGVLHYPIGSDYSAFPIPSGWTKVADL